MYAKSGEKARVFFRKNIITYVENETRLPHKEGPHYRYVQNNEKNYRGLRIQKY